jgi:hypothetical protein
VDEDMPEYLVWQKKEFVEILKRGQIVAVMPVQRFPGLTSVVVIHRLHQLAGHTGPNRLDFPRKIAENSSVLSLLW